MKYEIDAILGNIVDSIKMNLRRVEDVPKKNSFCEVEHKLIHTLYGTVLVKSFTKSEYTTSDIRVLGFHIDGLRKRGCGCNCDIDIVEGIQGPKLRKLIKKDIERSRAW